MVTMVGAIIGGIFFGFVSDKIGRKKTMVGAMVLCMVSMPLWISRRRRRCSSSAAS